MNKTKLKKFELYIVSLWLLFLLVVIAKVDIPVCFGEECKFVGVEEIVRRNYVALIAMFFLAAGGLFFLRFNHQISGGKKIAQKITKIEDSNFEHLTFLATYIMPVAFYELSGARDLLVLTVLLVAIGFIYVNTDKFYANPTLGLLGFKIYRVDLNTRVGEKNGVVVITRDFLKEGDGIRSLDLDNKVCYARRA